MNLYIRYFNQETLVHSVAEAMAFLSSIPDIHADENLEKDITSFVESPATYPKRYKVYPRVYFIMIKTTAETMEEFKSVGRKSAPNPAVQAKNERQLELSQVKAGWYEGTLQFKRVIPIGATGKFQYSDTTFVARVRCSSPQECYSRIVKHLRNRQDVDSRSQFPSARGKNFSYVYLGETLPKA